MSTYIVTTEKSDIRRVLNKFKQEELIEIAKELQIEVSQDAAKVTIIQELIGSAYSEGLTHEQLGQLELKYHQLHPGGKQWRAHTIGQIQGPKPPVLSPEELCELLQKSLKTFMPCIVSYREREDQIWFRVYLLDSSTVDRLPQHSQVIYIIYKPLSNLVLVSPVKVEYQTFFFQGLCSWLKCESLTPIELSGRHADSLLDLVLNSKSQGGYAKYRLGEVDQNPLCRAPKRKQEEDSEEGYVDEDRVENKRRKDGVDAMFGEHKQPVLERVTFQLAKDDGFRGKVHLVGPSVLEGVRTLVKLGIAEPSLPDAVADLHSTCSNVATIQ
eukprot:Colp12_sorted_trinity150504_noHs@16504